MSLSFKSMLTDICVISFLFIVIIECQSTVFLYEWRKDNKIYLNCSVCYLTHDVTLYTPSNYPGNHDSRYFAVCQADLQSKGFRKCGEGPSVTQDFSINTTSFEIGDIHTFNNYGIWTCTHGSDKGFYEMKQPDIICCETGSAYMIAFFVFFCLTVLLSLVTVWCGCQHKKWKNLENLHNDKDMDDASCALIESQISNVSTDEGSRSTENETLNYQIHGENCHTCNGFSTCALCVNCKFEYCEICCDAHTKYYPEHNVCQLEHFFESKSKLICTVCNGQIAKSFCTRCKNILCKDCKEKHSHETSQMKDIYNESTNHGRSLSSQSDLGEMEYTRKIAIKKRESDDVVYICGLAFIADCRIVIVDMNNRKLVVYSTNGSVDIEEKLKDEPRALTEMTGNNIAVTFGYTMKIRLYEITKESAIHRKTIYVPDLGIGNLKPFSISHHQDFFAVEVGECDSGIFILLDKEGHLRKRIPNTKNFAYFTGHTIRLALRMLNTSNGAEEGRIYVSVLSRKVVTCIDFNGNIIWNTLLPGPRSIILIPEQFAFTDNIICSSKGCGVIFKINEKSGKNNVLLSKGRIRSPRYMNYLYQENLICLQVANDTDDGYDILIYKYQTKQHTTMSVATEVEL